VPMDDRTTALLVGDAVTAILAAGPIFGPDESEPQAAATARSDETASSVWERITLSAR
jgi:hypothetical protein